MAKREIAAILLFVVMCLSFPAVVFTQTIDGTVEPGEYSFSQTFDNGRYSLSWNVGGEIAYFAISAKTTGWVAVAFDPVTLMEGADMVLGWIDNTGKAHILDAYAIGPYGPHPPDEELGGTQDVLEFAGREADGVTTVEFSRRLSTGDRYDKTLLGEGGNTIIWAYSVSDDSKNFHQRSGYGGIRVGEGKEISRGPGWLLVFHNVSLTVAFILMLYAMFVARYLKKKRWWLKVHRRSMIAGVVLSGLGILSVEYIIFRADGSHFRVIHSWLGAIAIVLLVVTPLYGRLILKSPKDRKPFFKGLHKWMGRSALIVTAAAIIYGLIQIQII
jgi:hypothetical protein